jgi:DNA-binding transcriptional ArsR family regulator
MPTRKRRSRACSLNQKSAVSFRDPDITAIARVFADRTRATIILHLLDGAGHDVTDLAARARVAPSTASEHLRSLLAANIVRVERRGKRRIYSLSDPTVQRAVEALASIAPDSRVRNFSLSRSVRIRRLAEARRCYDHAGGRLAAAITHDFETKGVLKPTDGGFLLLAKASDALHSWKIDLKAILDDSPFVRGCPDWTEGGLHIGGPLGTALYQRLKNLGAVAESPRQRYITVDWSLDRIISLTAEMNGC